MKKGIIEDVMRCVKLQIPERVPYLPLGCGEFDLKYSQVTCRQYRTDTDVMVRVQDKVVRDFDYDWALLFPDDLIEYEGCGIEVMDEENLPAAVRKYLQFNKSNVESLRFNEIGRGRMKLHLEGLRLLKDNFGDSVVVAGRIAAPFSTCGLIFGVEATLFAMIDRPKLLKQAMEVFCEFNCRWAQAQLEAGADLLWLGDCLATSYFISPDNFEAFAAEGVNTCANFIRDHRGISIYHGGDISIPHLTRAAQLCKLDAINAGGEVDLSSLKQLIGEKVCVTGNIDPIKVLRDGNEEDVRQSVQQMIQACKGGGGYMFCTGEGITPDTLPQNISAMTQAVREYGTLDQI